MTKVIGGAIWEKEHKDGRIYMLGNVTILKENGEEEKLEVAFYHNDFQASTAQPDWVIVAKTK